MKKSVVLILALFLGVTSLYAMSHGHMPKADGKAVIDYITITNPYTAWALWPGKGQLYKGQHPHGAFLTTYVDPTALEAITNKAGKLPVGAMVVKENYSPDKKLAAITVMYRVEGFNPDNGDWFWLKFTPDGTIEKEGKVAGCINCHKGVSGNDWFFTGPIQ